jgi:hypothetical protein
MTRVAVVVAACIVVTGCAKNPDAIPAIAMPPNAYSGLTCDQLAQEYVKASTELAQVEAAQRQAASGDAFGVFLIGVPMSSLGGGDKEGLVAQHKGEVIAINFQQQAQHCI